MKSRKKMPTFSMAATNWFEARRPYLRKSTAVTYLDSIKALTPFFGNKRLNRICIEHVRKYQCIRGSKVTPQTVNKDLGIFQQVMKEYDQWLRLERRYRPLPVPRRRAGHSLSAEEEQRLYEVAFSKKKWLLAAHCMVVMLNTTMGFGELRRLRRLDVDMERGCVTVREGAKNEYRHRTIPLNNPARTSMTFILERWRKLGGSEPEHYILPHRPRGVQAAHWRKTIPWILTEPTTSMHSAFRSIRKAAGLPHFRVYDCRVQAITKILSNPAISPQVSKEIAGHISQAMQDRYSIQQFDTKMAALCAIEQQSASEPPDVPLAPNPAPSHVQTVSEPRVAAKAEQLLPSPQTPAVAATLPRPEAFSLQGWTGNGFYFGSST